LPYRFDTSLLPDAIPAVFELAGAHVAEDALPPVVHFDQCVVAFVGFMPAAEPAFWLALPPRFAELLFVVELVVAELFFCCPGAFAEFAGLGAGEAGSAAVAGVAWEFPFPLPLSAPFPLPLPARAEPVSAARAIASTIVPQIPVRLVISFSPHIRTTLPQCSYGL
jgi:hypothetical protein